MYIEKKVQDKVENVLLEKTSITDKNKLQYDSAKEFVENYEEGIIDNYHLRKVKTEVGKACFLNNITELDIFENEDYLDTCVREIKSAGKIVDNTKKLFLVLYNMFFLGFKMIELNVLSMKRLEIFIRCLWIGE